MIRNHQILGLLPVPEIPDHRLVEGDPNYGQLQGVMVGKPVWWHEIDGHESTWPLTTADGRLEIRDPLISNAATGGQYAHNAHYLPPDSGSSHPFDRLTGVLGLLKFDTKFAAVGGESLGSERYKIVNLGVAPGVVSRVSDERMTKNGQIPHPQSPRFPESGHAGGYVIAESTGADLRVIQHLSHDDLVPEIPILSHSTETGEEIFAGYTPELLAKENSIMEAQGITPRLLLKALKLKDHVVAEGGNYAEILSDVRDCFRDSQGYDLLKILPETPQMPDSYLWRAFMYLRQTYNNAGAPRTLSKAEEEHINSAVTYYFLLSRIRVRLLEDTIYTPDTPYRLIAMVGSLDAVHDPVWGERHEKALAQVQKLDSQKTDTLIEADKRDLITGSLMIERPEKPHPGEMRYPAERLAFRAMVYALNNRQAFTDAVPPVPPRTELPVTPYSDIRELAQEVRQGVARGQLPKLPGTVGHIIVGDSESGGRQYVILSTDAAPGILSAKQLRHVPLGDDTIANRLDLLTDPRHPASYAVIRRTPEDWELQEPLPLGRVAAFEVVDGNPRTTSLHMGKLWPEETPETPASLPSGKRPRLALSRLPIIRPSANQKLVPVLEPKEGDALPQGGTSEVPPEVKRVAAVVAVDPRTGVVSLKIDSNYTTAQFPAPVGQRII